MKTRRFMTTRLWVEELEPRVVLSSAPSLSHQVATVATLSTNWSGYAAQTSLSSPQNNAVTAVSGSWVVPAVTGTGNSYSSFWVGIDGYSSNTVEQIGTDSDIQNGVPTYYAWYEMYPGPSYNEPLTLTVSGTTSHPAIVPGQTINASVTYTAATKTTSAFYTLSLTDASTGASFTTKQKLAGTQNSSAEWVAEAPSSGNGVLPLSDFGSVTFSNASATINGVSGPIDNTANASINMVSGRNNSVIAATGPLTDLSGTSSFTVTYHAPTAPSPPPPSQHHGWGWFGPDAAALPNGSDPMPDASAGTPEFSDTARMETTAAAFAALQAGRTFQQAAIRLDAPALAPMLSVLTLSGPRAGTLGDPGEPVDNAEPISIWLPADMATGRSAAPGSFAEVVTTQRSPVIVTDAAPPMQVVLGAQAGNVFAEPVPAPTPTPTPEQRGETAGNLVARTFSKALCLVGAVGLFAHAAFAGKSRQNDARDEATEKKQ